MTVRALGVIGCLLQLGLNVNAAEMRIPATVGADSVRPLSGARRMAVRTRQEVPIEETYRRQCAACHGEQGRGDGRRARRFKPPPADFRDPEGVAKLTDEELLEVIRDGRASMPAFGDVLSEDVLAVLVAYVRDLSRGVDR